MEGRDYDRPITHRNPSLPEMRLDSVMSEENRTQSWSRFSLHNVETYTGPQNCKAMGPTAAQTPKLYQLIPASLHLLSHGFTGQAFGVYIPGTALDIGDQAVGQIHTIHWHGGLGLLGEDIHSKLKFLRRIF